MTARSRRATRGRVAVVVPGIPDAGAESDDRVFVARILSVWFVDIGEVRVGILRR
jgi:hypothetical protein